jgi:hypothetical protein
MEKREKTPAEVWKVIEDEAREDAEIEEALRQVASMSDAEKEAELQAAGTDPRKVEARVEAALAEHAGKAPVVPIHARRARWRSRTVLWLAAAAVVVGAGSAAALIGERLPQPHRHTPTPAERAAPLREDAYRECGQSRWFECEQKLQQASLLDPAGDSDPRVVEARKQIADHAPGPK